MSLQDYSSVDLSPHKLSQEEIEDPFLVFDQLFDFAHLPQLREHLWLWLKITVTNSYCDELYTLREREMVMLLYEYLEKLPEAAWLLHQEAQEIEEEEEETDPDEVEEEGDDADEEMEDHP